MHCTIDMSMSDDIQELIGSDKKKKNNIFFKKPSKIILDILIPYKVFSSLRETLLDKTNLFLNQNIPAFADCTLK